MSKRPVNRFRHNSDGTTTTTIFIPYKKEIRETLISTTDYKIVSNKSIILRAKAGSPNYAGHYTLKGEGLRKFILLHRLILPDVKMIDHIDGNGLNNVRDNLRKTTQSQNNMNCQKHRDGSNKYKGVYKNTGVETYMARISANRKLIYLGSFRSQEEAAKVWDEAALKYHGKFARLNFPENHKEAAKRLWLHNL